MDEMASDGAHQPGYTATHLDDAQVKRTGRNDLKGRQRDALTRVPTTQNSLHF
jgi:hypothetical protein